MSGRGHDVPDRGALDGALVVTVGSGPSTHLCATYLAEFGARVVRIEPPLGDPLRAAGPGELGGLVWACVARAGSSQVCDTEGEDGRVAARQLMASADVVCSGIGPAELRALLGADRRPGAVVVYLSALGHGRENMSGAGDGLLAAAAGGLLALTGYPDGPPTRLGADYVEHLSAAFGAQAACVALRRSRLTGEGAEVLADGLGAVLRILEWTVPALAATGRVRRREGNHPTEVAPLGVFAAADGRHIALVGGSDANFRRLVDAMGEPWLLTDDRFATSHDRAVNHEVINGIVAAWVGGVPSRVVLARVTEAGAIGSLVPHLDEIVTDPHVVAREDLVVVDDPGIGRHRQPGPQPVAPQLRPNRRWRAPTLGGSDESTDDTRN